MTLLSSFSVPMTKPWILTFYDYYFVFKGTETAFIIRYYRKVWFQGRKIWFYNGTEYILLLGYRKSQIKFGTCLIFGEHDGRGFREISLAAFFMIACYYRDATLRMFRVINVNISRTVFARSSRLKKITFRYLRCYTAKNISLPKNYKFSVEI